jgi:hypothetical protein
MGPQRMRIVCAPHGHAMQANVYGGVWYLRASPRGSVQGSGRLVQAGDSVADDSGRAALLARSWPKLF